MRRGRHMLAIHNPGLWFGRQPCPELREIVFGCATVTVDLAQVNAVRLNLNLLGETILGQAEARRRLDGYLALLARDDVEYISVKISSMCSQLNHVAFDQTLTTVKERLRLLYQQALVRHF